jgi:hypothetical protein
MRTSLIILVVAVCLAFAASTAAAAAGGKRTLDRGVFFSLSLSPLFFLFEQSSGKRSQRFLEKEISRLPKPALRCALLEQKIVSSSHIVSHKKPFSLSLPLPFSLSSLVPFCRFPSVRDLAEALGMGRR